MANNISPSAIQVFSGGKKLFWSTSVSIQTKDGVTVRMFDEVDLVITFADGEHSGLSARSDVEDGKVLVEFTINRNTGGRQLVLFSGTSPSFQFYSEPNLYLSVTADVAIRGAGVVTICIWEDADA